MRRGAVALGLVLAVAAVWAPTLDAPFVYDDKLEVVGNPTIRVLTEWGAVATYNVARPLLIATYAVNWWAGALDPTGYHAVSIAIHALNAALALRLLSRWLSPERAALGAAAWALHPMVTEGVTYITGRSDALCATSWLVALTAWTDHTRGGRGRGLAIVAAATAALTKEVGATLPLALLALDLLVTRRPLPLRARVRDYAPFLALIGLAASIRLAAYGWPRAKVERSLVAHALTQAEAWAAYLRLWVAPVGQSVLHDLPNVARWQGVVAAAALLGLAALSRRAGALGLAALAAAWLLPSSLLPLKEGMAEHRAYLAGLALTAGVAAALPARLFRPPLLLVPLLLAAATVARNRVWESEITLWADAAAKNPASADAAYGLADAHRLARDPAAAERGYRAVLTLRPGDPNAQVNLGIVLAEQGRVEEARATWQALLRQDPRHCAAHNNLATLDRRAGRVREAAAGWMSTLRACPDDPIALYNLGGVYREMGELDAARRWYRRYLEVVPLGAYRADATAALRELGP